MYADGVIRINIQNIKRTTKHFALFKNIICDPILKIVLCRLIQRWKHDEGVVSSFQTLTPASAPLNTTKIGVTVVGPELLFSIYKCCCFLCGVAPQSDLESN